MRLRNKKTGVIGELSGVNRIVVYEPDMPLCENSILGEYDTLAELNKDWEDYKPTEPLIKDEKIRKVVRAWAEANDIDGVWHECATCWLRGNGLGIYFDKLELEQGNYSITELCGEEDE